MKIKQTKIADNNLIDIIMPALKTNLREVPVLGVEHRSAQWNGWVVACMPTDFLTLALVSLNGL